MTLEEFKSRGGIVAHVPPGISTVITRTKTRRFRTAPSTEWPDGREVEITGPEQLNMEIVDGRPMIRFSSINDWHDLRTLPGEHTLEWANLNPELCQLYASLNAAPKGAGPIRR